MKVLWFTWKDREHPAAGGAEVVNEEIAARLVARGHEVTFVVAGFRRAAAETSRRGFHILRVGSRWTVYVRAWFLYRTSLRGNYDVIVDEMNTLPFFCRFYAKEPVLLFAHQLAREIWWYEMPLPFCAIGYWAEAFYLRLLSPSRAITVSPSSKADLVRFGFRPERIEVMPQGIDLLAISSLSPKSPGDAPTVLVFGSSRPMKRVNHARRAFEIARRSIPGLRLVVAGGGSASAAQKATLMRDATLLCFTSVKEGWGLVVSEAAGQGTPTVAYDVDGVRDSVGDAGVLVESGNVQALADAIVRTLRDPEGYARMRERGWERARHMDFDRSTDAFEAGLKSL